MRFHLLSRRKWNLWLRSPHLLSTTNQLTPICKANRFDCLLVYYRYRTLLILVVHSYTHMIRLIGDIRWRKSRHEPREHPPANQCSFAALLGITYTVARPSGKHHNQAVGRLQQARNGSQHQGHKQTGSGRSCLGCAFVWNTTVTPVVRRPAGPNHRGTNELNNEGKCYFYTASPIFFAKCVPLSVLTVCTLFFICHSCISPNKNRHRHPQHTLGDWNLTLTLSWMVVDVKMRFHFYNSPTYTTWRSSEPVKGHTATLHSSMWCTNLGSNFGGGFEGWNANGVHFPFFILLPDAKKGIIAPVPKSCQVWRV